MVDYSITYPFTKQAAEDIRESLLAVVLDLIKSVQEGEEGYLLNFGRQSEVLQPVSQLVQVERVINPFMRMLVIVESNGGPIKLDLSGPTGTKEFLYSEFGLKRWMMA
ncbi:hypothetical protein FT643_10120 [Ketobacter sp. MCCC 1A13808]|uniref:hypothetical protein n=1 Tax=Ketobacter sp. MCCC 1A13808 TaxID=2602738 RepID=UPI0012EC2C7B|nr:hypothetical protein [Ketobacter sp. MCCC 1A13808]MVF12496.1 hypothetical protein [Ketobacter sp. MCCC 1A13808]